MGLRPLGQRVLVRRDVEVDVTKSGLVLPAVARELPQTAVVNAVGRGVTQPVRIGDRVIIPRYQTGALDNDRSSYFIHQDELIAVFYGHRLCPLNDRVVVQRDDPLTTFGSLIVPEDEQLLMWSGTVVAVGPGRSRRKGKFPPDVTVGNRVLIQGQRGQEIVLNGIPHLITKEEDLLYEELCPTSAA